MMAAPVSGVIGGPVSGALLHMHQLGLAGWQWVLILEGFPAILLGLIVLKTLKSDFRSARWLTSEERDWLQRTFDQEANAYRPVAARAIAGLTNINVWLLAAVYFGLNTSSYAITLWLPTLIHRISTMGPVTIGILSAVPNVCAAVIMVMVGMRSDRTGERRWHVAVSALVGALALIVAGYSGSSAVLVIAASFALSGVFGMVGPFWAMPSTLLSGAAAATGIALINAVGNLGGFFGPYILGAMRSFTGSFQSGLVLVAALLVISGCLALLVRFGESGRMVAPGG
jgi:nitrate/nitrite transporter NarK